MCRRLLIDGGIVYRNVGVVTYYEAGERCEVDGELGFIKFGSRIDVYLPLDANILVKLKQTVRGNTTALAKI